MRLTTKIIAGIILSTLLITLVLIISFSFSYRKTFKQATSYYIELPQNNFTGIELSSFNTVVIDEVPYESNEYKYYITDECQVHFDSTAETDDPVMMYIPESYKDFVSTDTYGDTLKVKIDKHGIGDKYKSEKHRHHSISGINIRFRVSNIDVINNVRNLSVNISNIETDSIKVNSNGDIFVMSCKAQYIEPILKSNNFNLNITNSEAKKVHLDLDNIRNRNIENSKIEEEYITGSGTHYITRQQRGSGKINWAPKNDNAELIIKIPGEPTQIIFP